MTPVHSKPLIGDQSYFRNTGHDALIIPLLKIPFTHRGFRAQVGYVPPKVENLTVSAQMI